MKNHNRQAFTLIELLIVLAIIAIIVAIAIPNLLRGRMAGHEAAAVAACKAYASAQAIYHRTDYDMDGVLEYSQSVRGNYSLYEITLGSGDLSLVDQAFANAEGDPGSATPKEGYVFRALLGQGPTAPGGSRSYVLSGNMTLGFALSAVSASYDITGRNTFLIGQEGTVYQKDRGSTETVHLTVYAPEWDWSVSE
jgi:prepilin-type N-terminal cleavage/methylation domain-containing protein